MHNILLLIAPPCLTISLYSSKSKNRESAEVGRESCHGIKDPLLEPTIPDSQGWGTSMIPHFYYIWAVLV